MSNCNKEYGYNFTAIQCIKNKEVAHLVDTLDFKEGELYPFLCLSYDTSGEIDPARPIQVISESGYKINFQHNTVVQYFDVTKVHTVYYQLHKYL
ncbi:MAG: hypothetical protein ATN36_08810 [Epulopiscium sp. Nele67-Bin005]|nr:MAG: hypothetical protein ATN36_08810 [Epulopiscium sp. Nele67-Bin005]